jgi:hypothetical protein
MPASATREWPAIVIAVLLSVASAAAVIWLAARPRDDAEVAAIFPPWVGRERAFVEASASGLVVRQGARDWILVVRGEGSGLVDRLYAAGAWAVVDPVAFGGCLVRSPDGDKG